MAVSFTCLPWTFFSLSLEPQNSLYIVLCHTLIHRCHLNRVILIKFTNKVMLVIAIVVIALLFSSSNGKLWKVSLTNFQLPNAPTRWWKNTFFLYKIWHLSHKEKIMKCFCHCMTTRSFVLTNQWREDVNFYNKMLGFWDRVGEV